MATFAEVKAEIRTMLQDPNGTKWSDDDIEYWINEAQLEYVRISGALKATMEIVPDLATQTYIYPENFLEFVYGWNYDDINILASSYNELQDLYGDAFYDEVGKPLFIYDDDADDSTYKLYPSPDIPADDETDYTYSETYQGENGRGIIQYVTYNGVNIPTFGTDRGIIYEMIDADYDITTSPTHGTVNSSIDFTYTPELGVTIDNGRGVEYEWIQIDNEVRFFNDLFFLSHGELYDALWLYELIGKIQYIRRPIQDTIEISDVEALKYYTVAQAFYQETAWKDIAYADALMAEFEDLVHKDSPILDIKKSNINYF
jgi:hypothetical protein